MGSSLIYGGITQFPLRGMKPKLQNGLPTRAGEAGTDAHIPSGCEILAGFLSAKERWNPLEIKAPS